MDDFIADYGPSSELIFVQNEHDLVLLDRIIKDRDKFIKSNSSRTTGLYCIKDDKREIRRHEKSFYQVHDTYTNYESYSG